jgi:hypothetical protein
MMRKRIPIWIGAHLPSTYETRTKHAAQSKGHAAPLAQRVTGSRRRAAMWSSAAELRRRKVQGSAPMFASTQTLRSFNARTALLNEL